MSGSQSVSTAHHQAPLPPASKSWLDAEAVTTREKLFVLFDDPHSSRAALAITLWILALTLISVVAFCLESMPELASTPASVWFTIDAVTISNFTVDYLVRVFTVDRSRLREYITSPLNVVDLIAIVPFYLELAISNGPRSLVVIRVVRLTRVFRL